MGMRTVIARLGVLVCTLAVLAPGSAHAEDPADAVSPLPSDEARLAEGQTVSYPQSLTRHGKRYVGGVAYTVVDASLDELTAMLADPSAYRQVLPHARDARLMGTTDGDQLVEITQGLAFVQAGYTLRLRADDDHRRVRFWVDRSKPHDIDDAWGFFRVETLPDAEDGSPRVLLTYGILVDLGPGLIRDFFEDRIQASLLTVPQRLREYASLRFRGRPRA
jgi:hypothetical protein